MVVITHTLPAYGFLQYFLLGGAAFFSAIVGGISSFGSGLVLTPVLTPILGIKAVIPVMAVAMTLGNLSRVWVYRRHIQARTLLQIMVPALPCVLLGTYIYKVLPQNALELVIGVFLLVIIPVRRYMAKKHFTPTPAVIIGAAIVFGIVSGALPGGGIVLMPILLGIGLIGGGIIGTDACIGMITNICKVIFFFSFSLLNYRYFLYGLLIGACMFPGTYLARWLLNRMHIKAHTLLIEILILFSGLYFILSVITS
ncbi:sulfite exporter TauE/SafE family protein [Acerihabitans sp.]|uniref:sulfite exporter TauE/SafE family protein n=1 Tax=Acerihabitans sp. TaxID=2811394 RepID=UPI002EDA646C